LASTQESAPASSTGSSTEGVTAPGGRTSGAAGNGVVVTQLQPASGQVRGLVQIQLGGAVMKEGAFEASLPEQVAALQQASATPPVASLLDGSALPDWLSFDAQNLKVVALRMPASALPLQVMIRFERQTIVVEIVEMK